MPNVWAHVTVSVVLGVFVGYFYVGWVVTGTVIGAPTGQRLFFATFCAVGTGLFTFLRRRSFTKGGGGR